MNNCNYEGFINFLNERRESNPWEYVAELADKSGNYYDVSQKYLCREDQETIKEYNNKGKKKEHKFILDILPVPFEGDIFNAKIIILTLNPGFIEEVNHTLYTLLNQDSQNKITDYHIQNLNLKCKSMLPNSAVNFIGDRYWLNKTREIREIYGFKESDIALIQYIGYQSKEFKDNKEIKQLKSIKFTKLLLEFIIKTKTDEDDYCFIIARKENLWNDELKKYYSENELKKHTIILKNKRNTTISKDNIYANDWKIIERIMKNKTQEKPDSTSFIKVEARTIIDK